MKLMAQPQLALQRSIGKRATFSPSASSGSSFPWYFLNEDCCREVLATLTPTVTQKTAPLGSILIEVTEVTLFTTNCRLALCGRCAGMGFFVGTIVVLLGHPRRPTCRAS